MIDQPPPVIDEEQLPPAAEPAEPPPPAPAAPVEPAPPAPPDPLAQHQEQVKMVQGRLQAAEAELARSFAALDAEERAASQQMQPLLEQMRVGIISPEQAAPIIERYNAERQARMDKANQIAKGAQELEQIKTQVSYELADQQRRVQLEPVARKMAISELIAEAAEKSGDPEGFPKGRLQKLLERTDPSAWRTLQEQSVEDHREQRLAARAAAGTDEMGGTGTGAALPADASAIDNIAAGLRQMYRR